MIDKRVSAESIFDPNSVTKSNPTITSGLLAWWTSLNQQQKIWYCELHPNSDLTKGHFGQLIFAVWGAARMRQYHRQQANDLRVCIMGAITLSEIAKLDQLYQLQLEFGVEK